jgi:hypothetical protein
MRAKGNQKAGRPKLRRLFALSILVGASLLTVSCGDRNGSGGGAEWSVGYTKELNPQLEATAKHAIDGGGSVDIIAKCDSSGGASSVTLDFDYFSKDDKGNGADSAYDTVGSGNFEHVAVAYSLDGGEVRQANSQTNYKNSARVIFSYISPDAKVDPVSGSVIVLGKLLGGVQDLQPFLHARDVKFQLPLGGGGTEIVAVNPQDSGFQDFVSQCKIDLKRIDAEVAKQQADAKAADQQKAVAQAKTDAAEKQRQQQLTADAARRVEEGNVIHACIVGDHPLKVENAATLSGDASPAATTSTDVPAGQIVTTVSNPNSYSAGYCEIEYGDGETAAHGFLPLAMLGMPDETAMPTPAASPIPPTPSSAPPRP